MSTKRKRSEITPNTPILKPHKGSSKKQSEEAAGEALDGSSPLPSDFYSTNLGVNSTIYRHVKHAWKKITKLRQKHHNDLEDFEALNEELHKKFAGKDLNQLSLFGWENTLGRLLAGESQFKTVDNILNKSRRTTEDQKEE